MKYLVDPFYRASNRGTVQGTGFGLSIVKRFVDLHKGQMLIESVVNKGTAVTITLPYLQQ
ncbi:sensor histidine kinase [Flavobacterium sp. GT3P67]|uniref:sensor histidine kinase n=1 Tax=Flavobacterium sp. GT3P67 TaxID=2541722 RepID=UPI0039776F0B